MRIAIFHELTPLSGARKVVEEYGKILSKNHIVDLFYVDEKEDKNIGRIFNNVLYFKFKEKNWKGNNWKAKIYKDSIELIRLYLLHRKIGKIINKNDYDFVFINPSKFTQAPFVLNQVTEKKVYYCQEPLRIVYDNALNSTQKLPVINFYYEKINRQIRKFIDRYNFKNADVILANSKYSKDNIEKAYGKKVYVCYLGVDVEKFIPLNIKKEYDLLFVGEKVSIEGYDLLKDTLDLYKKKPNGRFIERSIDGQGISENELIKEFNKAKIVLALSKNEPFGLIAIEAMSCGVLVIAIDEGGFRESIINNKTGYLIKRDTSELKEKIDLILGNESLREALGKSGRLHVINNFTWGKSVDNFLKIVNKNL